MTSFPNYLFIVVLYRMEPPANIIDVKTLQATLQKKYCLGLDMKVPEKELYDLFFRKDELWNEFTGVISYKIRKQSLVPDNLFPDLKVSRLLCVSTRDLSNSSDEVLCVQLYFQHYCDFKLAVDWLLVYNDYGISSATLHYDVDIVKSMDGCMGKDECTGYSQEVYFDKMTYAERNLWMLQLLPYIRTVETITASTR